MGTGEGMERVKGIEALSHSVLFLISFSSGTRQASDTQNDTQQAYQSRSESR